MKYKVIENFIDKKTCEELIDHSRNIILNNNVDVININRKSITSSSKLFSKLLETSENWQKLYKKINSEEFLDFCLKNLECVDLKNKTSVVNFYNNDKINKKYQKHKNKSNMLIKNLSILSIIEYILKRLLRKIYKFGYLLKYTLKNRFALELLFDYSVAKKGYFREIHRDSDNRLIVFLLYLNSFKDSKDDEGNLMIYKRIKDDENLSQPDEKSCELIKSISPKEGKLIIFLNSNDSYHAVKKIKDEKQERHFLYGAYTVLNKGNPFIDNKSKLKTNFNFYD